MAIVCLLSAKGSPGVTTSAIALALRWSEMQGGGRRTLIVEADPAGGDISAGFLKGSSDPTGSMLTLAAARDSEAELVLSSASVPIVADGTVAVLTGVPDSRREGALVPAWKLIRDALSMDPNLDLIVDMGRLDPSRTMPAWLREADVVLMLARPTLPSAVAASRLVSSIRATDGSPIARRVRLVAMDSPSAYSSRELESAVGVRLLGEMPYRPEEARVFSEGIPPRRNLQRASLMRAAGRLAEATWHEVSSRGIQRPAHDEADMATRSAVS